jgi:uncharacterized surface protein with fasciclin (FAS1) repeats
MRKFSSAVRFVTIVTSVLLAGSSFAAHVMVGGQAMFPTRDISANTANSADHSTLQAAITAAGLADTLKGAGPYTVFAPTNAAFAKLPPGTVPTLLKPENKKALLQLLTYHMVAGKFDVDALAARIAKEGGKATLSTLAGGQLVVAMNGKHNMTITDDSGAVSNISIYDVYQSNGVIHVIDNVLMP